MKAVRLLEFGAQLVFVAFGRPYIANPDLVRRFAENAPLAEVDWETVYAAGPHGYSDYPTYQSSEHNTRS
jgi:N-ethylmaleimide reductase